MRFVFVLALSGCMVFDESMRRPHDAGATSSSSSSSSTSGSTATCTVDAPASGGVGGCGGKGGGTFEGAAVSSGAIELGRASCGEGAATLMLTVSADDCVNVYFASDSATAVIKPPGGAAKTANGDTGFHITADGALTIAITGTGSWRVLAR